MKRTAFVVVMLAAAVLVTGAGRGGEQPALPPLDPEYVRWAKLWDESRQLEAEVARQRYDIAFLRVMDALALSRQQMEQMLPLARKARDGGRAVIADFVAYFERVDAAKRAFADDIMVEDLVEKQGRPTINGNFDLEIWKAAEPFRHPPPSASNREKEALRQQVRRCGEALDEILTPQQRQLFSGALKQEPGKNDLAWCIQGLQATWIQKFNFVPVPLLGTLNTGNSIQNFSTPSTGLLLAPRAVSYLEERMGLPLSPDPGLKEALEQVDRAYYLARVERQVHRRQTIPYNWMKGAQFTRAQTEQFARLSRELLPLYIAEEAQWQKRVHEYLAMLGRIHGFVARGQPVPEDLAGPARTLGAEVVGSYWSGAAQGGTCAEDRTFRARRSGIWQMFPDQVNKLVAEADAVLGEGQKIVIWDVHGECYQPWQVFTSPINAGEPAKGLLENPKLKSLRKLPAEKADPEIETLAQGQLLELRKRWEGMKKPATEEQLRGAQAHLVDLLKQVRRMTDAEYELNKMALTQEFNGGGKDCDYVDNPNGFGTPEQNGIWPKPDWNDKEVKERWGARLENLLLPEMVPFFQTRAALMRQFKPRELVDLDKLPRP